MNVAPIIALVNNAALLLSLGLLYDMVSYRARGGKPQIQQALTGFMVGIIGIIIMLNPWVFSPGIVFDTRSALLSISGLFFGMLPTLVATVMTSAFSLYEGGGGAWIGVTAIVTSGAIGVAWRHLRRREAVNISTGELYVMGLVANAVPLLGLFFLPWPLPLTVLSQISLPVIVILPLATALLGWMMVQQGVRKQADHEMEERRRYLEGVLRAAPDAIVTLDANHHIVEWNPGADRLFGYSEEEVRGKNIDNLITGTNKLEEAAGLTKTVMSGKEVRPTETVRYRKDGSAVDVILAGSPILIGDKFAGAVAVYTDISERKRMEEQLAHIATHDALTDLPNRLLFGDRLKLTTANARRNQNKLALLMLDLDHFKDVNDTLGHRIGDRLLQAVSERLTSLLRESDTVARMGGDEFMLILPEVDRAEDAAVVAEKILKSFQKEFILDGHKLNITTSVGIAIYPDDSEDRGELVKKVDIAMYHAKQAGRNNFQHYSNWGVT